MITKLESVLAKFCYCCGTTTSTSWYHNYDEQENLLCFRCGQRLIYRPRSHYNERLRRFRFKDKRLRTDHVVRIGVCIDCGHSIEKKQIKVTNLHHEQYDESEPLAHTVELCQHCHKHRHVPNTITHSEANRRYRLRRKLGLPRLRKPKRGRFK